MLLKEIHCQNLLSFGPDSKPFELRPLNVLIGPNGSGKSNLIDAISILQGVVSDIEKPFRKGGGITEWLWKGSKTDIATITIRTDHVVGFDVMHSMSFRCSALGSGLVSERFTTLDPESGKLVTPVLAVRHAPREIICESNSSALADIDMAKLTSGSSLAFQTRFFESADAASYVAGTAYEKINLYREWTFGRSAPLRELTRADEPGAVVASDYANLAGVLGRAASEPPVKRQLLKRLEALCPNITDIVVSPVGGYLELVLHVDDFRIPASRLSDGTLRYLCLLAILCDPKPPGLICLEEPELGMHPDVIPTIAELLKEASERTQLIVTTHSDVLVDCFTDSPESVVVCEKHNGQTEMTRLDGERLSEWLKEYSLGTLWSQGQIGGNRW